MKRFAIGLLALVGMAATTDAEANLSISGRPTRNVSCEAGVCTATAATAVLNVTDLQTMLASGDVAVKTGTPANDIEIDQPLTWSTANRLTLDAQHSVIMRKAVSVAGAGAVTIVTNDGEKGGELSFLSRGKLDFSNLKSDLTIDGEKYFLAATVIQLAELALQHARGNIALASDYDATLDGVYAMSPVGGFRGTLNGLGHTISHLFVRGNAGYDVGLVGYLDKRGHITSLAIRGAAFFGGANIGGLAGISRGLIDNSSFTGSNSGGFLVGGIAGENYGTILRAQSDVSVTGRTFAGGVAGANIGAIDESFATGTARVSSGGQSQSGGLVGVNQGPISNSYALGKASAPSGDFVGGFVGSAAAKFAVSTSYSTGVPSGGTGSLIGGFMGVSDGTIQSSYWDVTTSGTSEGVGEGSDAGLSGVTDVQLKSGLPAGFDPEIWGQSPSINDGYPYLLANPPR